MFRIWAGIVSLVLALVAPGLHAQGRAVPQRPDCSVFRQVTFADGTIACIERLPVSGLRAANGGSTVLEAADRRSLWSLSMPLGACPAKGVYGFSAAFGVTSNGDMLLTEAKRIAEESLAACRLAAGAGASACDCAEVLATGKSVLTRAEFDALAQGEALAAAPAAPSAPPVARPRPEPPPAAAPDSRTAAQDDRVAMLERELQQLRERVQQSAGKAPGPAKPRVRALVIGNGAYASFGRLPNPRNDAEAMAAKLRSFGISVDLALDTTRERLVRTLSEFASKSLGSDVNILFYAGHGVQVEGINYIVPTDLQAEGVTPGYLKLNAVSLNAVLDHLPAKTRLVFLDACRDNPVSRSLLATRSAGGVGLAPVSTTSGTLIAYATKDGSTAEDGRGRHSPYTEALLEHLDKQQDIAVVLRQVRQSVMRSTSNRQEPWEYGSLIGDQLVLSQVAR
jgi:hypothetical protein